VGSPTHLAPTPRRGGPVTSACSPPPPLLQGLVIPTGSHPSLAMVDDDSEIFDDYSEKELFEAELEFVQALANPEYLHYLAQNRYFDDDEFIAYLEYLQYWARPPYVQYLVFPHCLRFLELLQGVAFRAELKREDFKNQLFRQQHFAWKYRASTLAAAALPRETPVATADALATATFNHT